MPPIDNIRKSLVDVALGALAFLCSVDRSAVPITRTLSVLAVCTTTWLALVITVLSSPALIGGESPASRFSELAPVIVLSSPMLWAALRRAQVLLETIDTLLGALTLSHSLLKRQKGVFDDPQSFRRTHCLHILWHSVRRDDSPYPRASRLMRLVHFAYKCRGKRCEFETNQQPDESSSVSEQFIESMTFKWSSELLPLGASNGMILPRHLYTDVFVKDIYAHRRERPNVQNSPPDSSRIISSTGIIASIPYCSRHLLYLLRCASLRVAPHAVLGDVHVTVNNFRAGWASTASSRRLIILLTMRRAAVNWSAILTKHTQGLVSAIISSVDAFVGEISGFVLVSMLEFAHPLKLRRENAMYILRDKGAVVADIFKHRELLKRTGHDRYMDYCANAILVCTIMTILKGREDLVVKAIVMIRCGNRWRRKPQQEYLQGARDRQLFHENLGIASLPKVSPTDLDAIVLGNAIESNGPEAVTLTSAGEIPMVLLSPCVSNAARQRGYVPGALRSGAGGRLFAGLCIPENDEAREAKDSVVEDFCADGWVVGLYRADQFNSLKIDWNTTYDECISEMVNVCMDCHATVICSFLSCMAWAEVKSFAKGRLFANMEGIRDDIVKVEQHDFLVACHRNEVTAVACMFVDEVMDGNWLEWQKLCVSDALALCKNVFT